MRDHTLEAIRPERAAFAALVPFGREHEVLDHELRPALEEIRQCRSSVGALEQIGPFDFRPGQRAPLFAEAVAGACEFLFMREQRLARFDPFLLRDDLVRLHGGPPIWFWTVIPGGAK